MKKVNESDFESRFGDNGPKYLTKGPNEDVGGYGVEAGPGLSEPLSYRVRGNFLYLRTVPIAIAGGPKFDTIKEALEITYNAMNQGPAGVDMGRNIWQSAQPTAMIRAIHAIVKEGFTVKEAVELYESCAEVRA